MFNFEDKCFLVKVMVFKKEKTHKWQFSNVGGTARVKISTGADIAHLPELDIKMWTVLSCPVKGLEIAPKSLTFMDCDSDGKIRVNDILAISKWLTDSIKNPDLILKGSDSIKLDQFNIDSDSGNKLYNSALQILQNLGKDTDEISIADTADIAAVFAKTRFNGDGVITVDSSDDEDEKSAIAAAVAATGGVMDRSGVMGVNVECIDAFYKALADYVAWCDAKVEAPYGEYTDKVIEAYHALDAKVKDYFMRSKLAAFSPSSASALDVQNSHIEAISAQNLTSKVDEIALYPLAHITGKPELDLETAVNPAWATKFELIKTVACQGKTTLTEEGWAEIGASFAAYEGWKGSKAGAQVEALGLDTIKEFIQKDKKEALLALVQQDAALKDKADNIDLVDKFLYVYRDFYRLLRNFITFDDFYSRDKKVKAIFQSGSLVIDQRECKLCMLVADMAKHNTMAALSGAYLLYCDCTTKSKPGKIQIVAVLTVGEVRDLYVGKNAVYYDNEGLEWDAVVTKIVDNPISVGQAFWSPYRRMSTTIENLISKKAAEKDAKMMEQANAKINSAPDALAKPAPAPDAAAAPAAPAAAPAPKPPFDIAKFAGIFAAIGMAVGMIGTMLVTVFQGFVSLTWWQMIMVFVGLMLLISGPSMILAWLKIRRRNIAPLLNANGWAVNAVSKISIPFGETLTDSAKFPKIRMKDPYAKKMAAWKKWLISIVCLAAVVAGLWLYNVLAGVGLPSPLERFNKKEKVETVVEEPIQEEVVLDPLIW